MIPKKQLEKIKKEIEECQNPFFFFHDDMDGLCSFLLLYRFKGEGKWHMVKQRPFIEERFAGFVPEDCDKVFVLDIATMDQEFVNKIKKPVVWIDHHTPQKISNADYFNPRIKHPNEYTPVSAICYNAVKQDLLIGAIGTTGDLSPQPYLKKFFKEHAELVGKHRDLFELTFETKFGKLIRILELNLKGKTADIKKSLVIFSRTRDFTAFLEPKTKDEKFVYERYEKLVKEYESTLGEAYKVKGDPFIFKYQEGDVTFGSDLGREIPYRIPGKKMYIIYREKSGRMLCSLRSYKINLVKFLENALTKVEGYGGGHPVAVGCNINKDDFEKFIELAKNA